VRASEICQTAANLVGGDRNVTHGDIAKCHEAIAASWNGFLQMRKVAGRDPMVLDAHDVANMMEVLKVARRYNGAFNPDNYVDGCGYSAVAYECAKPVTSP